MSGAASGPEGLAGLFLFEGYGVDRPRVVFIGMEEASDDSLANLERRLTFSRRMDLREAHESLFGPGSWQKGARRVRVWQVAAQLRAALAGVEVTDPRFDATWRHIRDNELGRRRPEADTLLTELLPVPTNRHGIWPDGYSQLLGYPGVVDYRREQLPRRRTLLRQMFLAQPPEVVFCYGQGDWGEFRRTFEHIPDDQWDTLRSAPAAGGSPQTFQIGTDGQTIVALTNHFSGRGSSFSRQHIPSVVRGIRKLRPDVDV